MAVCPWLCVHGCVSMAVCPWLGVHGWVSMAGCPWLGVHGWVSMAGCPWLGVHGCVSNLGVVNLDKEEGAKECSFGSYCPILIGDKIRCGRYLIVHKLGWDHFTQLSL
ncbi:hypothetical protein BS47DRAFT_1163141 [Hydnum rufescens UP504]|uniref:Uncharacterized protein n=1 Tax=Hydnum rufescens UP504 TaxID=1448309 RepID=A0A9P6DUF5_9AGAM|nr:hypothetical protein BS47DRAFT_1163141 [Hydnum rufescens UP504]